MTGWREAVDQAFGHAAVANAAVYPVASVRGEDEVMAAHVTDPDLVDCHQSRLTDFSVPTLPLADVGKVQKSRLVTTNTWDRGTVGYEVRRPRAGSAA